MKPLSKLHQEAIIKAQNETDQNKAAAMAMIETPIEMIKAIMLKHEIAVIEVMRELEQAKQDTVKAEREACAKVLDEMADQLFEENERLHVENRRLIDRIETIGVPVGVGGYVTTTSQPEQEPVAYTGNGTAGRETDVKPTGFFFQADKIGTYTSDNPEHQKLDLSLCDAKRVQLPIKEALAQPEQEPVVWMYQDKSTHEVRFQKHMRDFVDHGATYETPLYTTPPQRTWVGLTDEDKAELDAKYGDDTLAHLDAIEAKLKEKNT